MKLKAVDGRGMHGKEIGDKNRAKIIKWMKENPNKTQKEISEGTGFSVLTVSRHLKVLDGE
ncbi:MAG: winged helix-turn-helix transcriptional regulator [Desulfobacteraceae bacterium]|nr:winged helix-turn-helix transcriptional regulator [Desulfobacteraceae bacterium]